jgi:hypothetical protein
MTKEFESTLQDIDQRCRRSKIPYAVIGGMAAIIHGSTRTTVDIDMTILAEIDDLQRILQLFADGYISVKPNPLAFFHRCLFVPLLHRVSKIRVDVTAALSGFERTVIKRSKRLHYLGMVVSVCTVEDLIIMKLIAARTKDIFDLETLFSIHRRKLDVRYLRARAKEFIAVERSDVPEKLEEFLGTRKSRRKK